jgi:outer membrane receptor protein involved in Fe transport
VLAGLRYDYFGSVKTGALQPRLTARWQITPRVTVKGGAGLFAQEPQPWEPDEKFGNPNLKLEHARHYSVGAEFKPRPYLTFDGTFFYKNLTNLVSATNEQVTDASGTHPLVYDNKGVGRVYGMELIARHEFSHNFVGWLAYTLSRSERRDSGKTDYRLFDFDQTHILSVIGSYQLPRNWTIGGRFRYVTGNPITPVAGSVVNSSADRYDPVYGRVNSARLGDFHQLDLRIDKRWIYPRWILDVYLDLQNVYNRSNPEAVMYNYNFRLSKPQQGLPILPILGIRGEF